MQTAAYTALRRIRNERGYSIRALGALLGCSGEAVRLWELGTHRPHPRYRARLQALMGAPLDELVASDPQNTNGADPKADAVEESRPLSARKERLHAQA